jgi:hypothetical protein
MRLAHRHSKDFIMKKGIEFNLLVELWRKYLTHVS